MSLNLWRRALLLAGSLFFVVSAAQAATIGPSLAARLASAGSGSLGVVIVAFDTAGPVDATHLAVLHQAGITRGLVLRELGMVAVPATAAQVRQLAAAPAVRSVWGNDPLTYFMHQARVLAGVDRVREDAGFTARNGAMPVSGSGDFSVVINDSGIDATHGDLPFGRKVVENVQIVTDTDTLAGFTPLLAVSGVPDTDTHVGHGTHCAGILGGTGERSGGLYEGVAPGAKLIGTGSGAGLFILSALGGFEWSLANQALHKIRVISNSWGSSGAFDPASPINIASRRAHDRNIVVVFAGGNAGPGPDTYNPYAKAPWVIGVAAGTKEGGLAGFSSRGTPKERRLGDADPHNDYDAPTITAPGTGREFEVNAERFTLAMVSTRAASNVVSTGLTDDTEIPPAFVPFYTQISGTSMATPFVAGVAALMLDADITLTPDDVKKILVETASLMPGYEEYEVGAGYVNAYAAVDKVFKRTKTYARFTPPKFNYRIDTRWGEAERFSVDYVPQPPGPTSSNTYRFTVAPGMGILDVRIDAGNNAATAETGNILGLMLYAPDGRTYNSGIALPILNAPRREIIVRYPAAGEWVAEVRGMRGLAAVPEASSPVGLAVPERIDGLIHQAAVTAAPAADIAGHAAEEQITTALLTRQVDVLADGLFHPDALVTRIDFTRHLAYNTAVRQYLHDVSPFTDLGGGQRGIVEAVTANGSTLRDHGFDVAGMMSPASGRFNPGGNLRRLDLAVALVRALGLDAEARARGSDGYMQIALEKGILQADALGDPRPLGTVTRATMAAAFAAFRTHFAAP